MKKAINVNVTYRNNTVKHITLLTCKGDYVALKGLYNSHFDTCKELIKAVIHLCYINGYEIKTKQMFNNTFYNISLIDMDNVKGEIIDTLAI